MYVGANGHSVLAGGPCDGPCHPKEGKAAEDKVTPLRCVSRDGDVDLSCPSHLVARRNQCTDETRNDHDLVNQQGVQDGRPRKASGQ